MNIKQLAGCFLMLATILVLVVLFGADLVGGTAVAAAENTPTPAPQIVVLEVVTTPVPTPDPEAPTAPPQTPVPVFVLSDFANDPQEVETAAKSAYRSPFTSLYWKFVLWSTQYNRTICPAKIEGFFRYARTYVAVTTDKNEYPFWSAETPRTTRGEELLRLNVLAADLFFDYIKSTASCGSAPVVPYGGVILEFVKDENGLNRSARVYDLDGRCLELMSEAEFNDTIGREYARRLNGTTN